MTAVTKGSLTTQNQVQVTWSSVSSAPANGGASVISYNLQWDQGTNGITWYNLVGSSTDSTATQYTATSSVVAGTYYRFRIRAKNKWGWGSFSSVTIVQASYIPDQVTSVSTSISSSTGDLVISWSAPNSRSNSIIAYKIEV
jgi:hypothetical protein